MTTVTPVCSTPVEADRAIGLVNSGICGSIQEAMCYEPTAFYKIKNTHLDAKKLKGPYNGEFLNRENFYSPHFVSDPESEEDNGGRRSIEGEGDIVVDGISKNGWRRILKDVKSFPRTQLDFKHVLAKLDYIDWKGFVHGYVDEAGHDLRVSGMEFAMNKYPDKEEGITMRETINMDRYDTEEKEGKIICTPKVIIETGKRKKF